MKTKKYTIYVLFDDGTLQSMVPNVDKKAKEVIIEGLKIKGIKYEVREIKDSWIDLTIRNIFISIYIILILVALYSIVFILGPALYLDYCNNACVWIKNFLNLG